MLSLRSLGNKYEKYFHGAPNEYANITIFLQVCGSRIYYGHGACVDRVIDIADNMQK